MILGSIGASVHPMVTVTQPGTALVGAATAVVGAGASGERTSNPSSSPSHSQISRNSSRKSNNSILVVNGKIEGFSFFFSTQLLSLYCMPSNLVRPAWSLSSRWLFSSCLTFSSHWPRGSSLKFRFSGSCPSNQSWRRITLTIMSNKTPLS